MGKASHDQVVTVEGRTIKLSNLDKVLYPQTQTTKADVLSYYAQVGPTMLPHLRDRPATRKRWPDGVGEVKGKRPTVFFNKDLGAGTPDWVPRRTISHKDHDNDYPVINDLATLTWLAQLAALEIHVPQWRFGPDGRFQNPDRLVLDLDPGPGVSLAECATMAMLVRDILRDIGHDPIPVTSGSKGIHLYAPLDGSQTSEQATQVARELARALESDHPDLVISTMKRSQRDGKVFIDWSQNNGAKTTVSPYSLRGRDRPWVAAPRTWDELDDPDLQQLEYEEVITRLTTLSDPLAAMAPSADRDRLVRYRSMRDPTKTPEPVPAGPSGQHQDGFRFVIQEHHARRLHYDVRLERDGVLASWAVPKAPPTDPKTNHLAVRTEDHPLEYLTFHGTIPKGEYGAGNMRVWDTGTYRLHKWREGKEVIVTLFGQPGGGLGGVRKFALIHTGSGESQPAKNWLMHLMETDPEDREGPSTGSGHMSMSPEPFDKLRTAPVEGRSTADLEFPEQVDPMLATPIDAARFGDETGWAFEMKWDGVRAIAYLAGGRVKLLSRKGRDDTAAYFEVARELTKIRAETAILDGEVVVTDSAGRPSFGLLQHRINLTKPADIERAAKAYPAQLMLFDILELNGQPLIKRTYQERRAILEDLVPPEPGSLFQVPPIFEGDLQAALQTSDQLQLEGVVAKRRNSIYQPGRRTHTWLKIKLHRAQEVVIGGWREGQGRRGGGVGSLLMGIPTEAGLHYVGRVGSGFNDRQLDEIQAKLEKLSRKTSPFVDVPREDARDAHWATPSLVGEVSYGELTEPGRLRHPVWRGLRPDKSPGEVVWEGPTSEA
ncbi:MAG TPA: ATP-dependent DNA ligase [Propionibacteriaceae bacterium]|nr:ATP-dependent DNA ligase [Propionibacteriaceae bacterium]